MKINTYTWTDPCGNRFILMAGVDGVVTRVVLSNQHRVALCLSNVGFNITDANGSHAQRLAVRDAALKGLQELRRVTKLDWQEVRS